MAWQALLELIMGGIPVCSVDQRMDTTAISVKARSISSGKTILTGINKEIAS
jgi:hypothetical protein